MKQHIKLMIAGVLSTVSIPSGLQTAHGTGLDGVTKVESLKIGKSPDHEGKLFVQDASGNTIMTDTNELFAALTLAAPEYKITAVKKSQ